MASVAGELGPHLMDADALASVVSDDVGIDARLEVGEHGVLLDRFTLAGRYGAPPHDAAVHQDVGRIDLWRLLGYTVLIGLPFALGIARARPRGRLGVV